MVEPCAFGQNVFDAECTVVRTEERKENVKPEETEKELAAVMEKGFGSILNALTDRRPEQQTYYSCGQPGHYANVCPDK